MFEYKILKEIEAVLKEIANSHCAKLSRNLTGLTNPIAVNMYNDSFNIGITIFLPNIPSGKCNLQLIDRYRDSSKTNGTSRTVPSSVFITIDELRQQINLFINYVRDVYSCSKSMDNNEPPIREIVDELDDYPVLEEPLQVDLTPLEEFLKENYNGQVTLTYNETKNGLTTHELVISYLKRVSLSLTANNFEVKRKKFYFSEVDLDTFVMEVTALVLTLVSKSTHDQKLEKTVFEIVKSCFKV